MANNTNKNNSDEISAKEIALNIASTWHFLKSKRVLILGFFILGGIIGLLYSIIKKPVYKAVSTFVLEDGKSGGMSQYAGLASLAGIDLGGMGGENGIFKGDNIIELYKSRLMIEKTLLSEVNISGKKQLIIDRYIDFNNLRDRWKRDNLQNIVFTGDPVKFNRVQDSIITNIVEQLNKDVLRVDKADKKLSIINVIVLNEDEIFAKNFNNVLVETVNEFYSQTKTKKSGQNVKILEHQADSIKKALNSSISGVASAIDATPNSNPALVVLKVPSQKRQIDVQASTAIYAEIVKNLEISKMSLMQETPLIQIIDQPVLPLYKTKVGKIQGIIVGGILAGMMCLIYLVSGKILKRIMA